MSQEAGNKRRSELINGTQEVEEAPAAHIPRQHSCRDAPERNEDMWAAGKKQVVRDRDRAPEGLQNFPDIGCGHCGPGSGLRPSRTPRQLMALLYMVGIVISTFQQRMDAHKITSLAQVSWPVMGRTELV